MQGVIWSATQLYECALFLEDYERFVRLKDELVAEHGGGPAPVSFSRLRVEHVSFSYPGVEQRALRDVSLDMQSRHTCALKLASAEGQRP
jgi:ATP-binding cassette, subfamily B, bacterial